MVEKSADGSRVVRPAKFNPEAMALIHQAEVHYRAERYAEARKALTAGKIKPVNESIIP